MLKRYMHKRERYFAMLNDNRIVHPFGWGAEFIKENANGGDPRALFREYSKRMVANSDEFFHLPEISDYKVQSSKFKVQSSETQNVTWTSGIETPSAENNTVRATFFPFEKDKRSAGVVLPHWNAKAGTYLDLCKIFNKVGVSSLRLTLQYQEDR